MNRVFLPRVVIPLIVRFKCSTSPLLDLWAPWPPSPLLASTEARKRLGPVLAQAGVLYCLTRYDRARKRSSRGSRAEAVGECLQSKLERAVEVHPPRERRLDRGIGAK